LGAEDAVQSCVACYSGDRGVNTFKKMWECQREFQKLVLLDLGQMSDSDKAIQTRDFCMYMVGEMTELLREMDWKSHRREVVRIKSQRNVLEELIDIFKYWMTVCLIHGFTPDDIVAEFWRKSAVVFKRWTQEHTEWDPELVVVVDIDMTLADYVAGLFSFLRAVTGVDLSGEHLCSTDVPAEIVRLTGVSMIEAIHLKHQFREEGWKVNLPIMPGAASFLRAVRSRGGQIVLLTARPYPLYRRIFADTVEWMEKYDLPFDGLWMTEDKRDFLVRTFPKVVMVVDDNPTEAVKLAGAGYQMKVPPHRYNEHISVVDGVERISLEMLAVRVTSGGLKQ